MMIYHLPKHFPQKCLLESVILADNVFLSGGMLYIIGNLEGEFLCMLRAKTAFRKAKGEKVQAASKIIQEQNQKGTRRIEMFKSQPRE